MDTPTGVAILLNENDCTYRGGKVAEWEWIRSHG